MSSFGKRASTPYAANLNPNRPNRDSNHCRIPPPPVALQSLADYSHSSATGAFVPMHATAFPKFLRVPHGSAVCTDGAYVNVGTTHEKGRPVTL